MASHCSSAAGGARSLRRGGQGGGGAQASVGARRAREGGGRGVLRHAALGALGQACAGEGATHPSEPHHSDIPLQASHPPTHPPTHPTYPPTHPPYPPTHPPDRGPFCDHSSVLTMRGMSLSLSRVGCPSISRRLCTNRRSSSSAAWFSTCHGRGGCVVREVARGEGGREGGRRRGGEEARSVGGAQAAGAWLGRPTSPPAHTPPPHPAGPPGSAPTLLAAQSNR